MTDTDIDRYMAQLRESNWYDRYIAVLALGRSKHPQTVDLLLEALEDQEIWVRYGAICSFEQVRDARAVEPLCRLIADSEWNVRHAAIRALGRIGDVRAVEPLCRALQDNDAWVRRAAASAIAQMEDTQSLPKKVIGTTLLTGVEKFSALNALRNINYRDSELTLHCSFNIEAYCGTCLDDLDVMVRRGAQEVLDHIDATNSLLRPSQWKEALEPKELLRAASGTESMVPPEESLRASMEPNETSKPTSGGILRRLFGRR